MILPVLAGLYFAQGLPFGFFGQAVPVLLRQGGSSLTVIGFSNLVALPWALKFLWSPFFDRPALRMHRGRVVAGLQVLTLLLLLGVAAIDPRAAMPALLAGVLLVNLLCATQDIATDALAVDGLRPEQRGWANGLQVGGYRVGMVVGGGFLLAMAEERGWSTSVMVLAGLLAVASLPVLLVRAPAAPAHPVPAPDAANALGPWLARDETRQWLGLLMIYKAGDAFGTAVVKPMLVDQGLGLAEVGHLFGTLGSGAAVAGAGAGAWIVGRLRRPLEVFAALQALTVGLWAYVAAVPTPAGWTTAVVAEHFFSAMATTGLFAAMMGACRPGRAASDYTVQASMVVVAQGVSALVSGVSADALGYVGHFVLATVGALLVIPAARIAPRAPWGLST